MKRALVFLFSGCATLADPGGGDVALPNVAAGPFRPIALAELGNGRAAPYGIKDDEEFLRDPAVLDEDGDPTTAPVVAYVAVTLLAEDAEPDPAAPPNAIGRTTARDGRSFERQLDIVLEPELDWEGGTVGAPAVVRVGAETWLFYGAAGGIGLATSGDGLSFTRSPAAVLGPAEGWEAGAVPASPSVVALPDGSFRLFYQVAQAGGAAIGEARSDDGVVWQRIGAGPLAIGRGPAALIGATPEGRPLTWLYFEGRDAAGAATIELAARFGFDGPVTAARSPVYSQPALDPREPALVRFAGFTLLYVTQRAGTTDALAYPAVAIGVAPAIVALAPPDPP